MFNNLNGKQKKIAAGAVSLLLVAAITAGIVSAVRSTTSSTVAVVPVSDLNYGNYLDWQNSVTGLVTTQAEQNVYLSDTEKVEEVLVEEGQAVHKGDVLLRYDTRATELKLEKEKIAREKIELAITVAKENIKTLENASPTSDGGDFDLSWDFSEFDPVDVLNKAEVHEHILKADAKPVSDDPDDVFLGTEDSPYVFLCKGGSVVITKDFIKKWQKTAAKRNAKHLYIALQVRDGAQALQKAWITDIMLLSELYDIEVDMSTGKTSYAAMNKPEELAALLRKILKDVPEDERGAWLAAMLDKLLITTEKEDKLDERGELLAAMLDALSEQDKEEFAAAAALLDGKTLSVMFESLSENLTPEQVEKIDPNSLAAMLTMLLDSVTEEQIKAIDSEVLASFLKKLSAEQIGALEPEAISAILSALSEEQIQGLDQAFLTRLFTGMTSEQIGGLDANEMKQFFDRLTEEQLKALIEVRGDEIEELLKKQKEEEKQQEASDKQETSGDKEPSGDSGSGTQDGSGSGTQGNSGTSDGTGNKDDNADSGNTTDSGNDADTGNSTDSGNDAGAGNDADTGNSGDPENTDDSGSGGGTGTQDEPDTPEPQQDEPAEPEETPVEQEPESEPEPAQNDNASEGGSVPETAPSPVSGAGTGTGSAAGNQILSGDISYTSDELAKARREEKERLRDLELNLKESEIKIEKAQKALDKGVVTATMDGVVKTAGDPDSPPTDGSAFITVSGTDGLYVKSGVKESKLGTIKEGDTVTVTSWQTGGQYEARVGSISPYPDTTGMFDGSGTETYYPFTAVVTDKNAVMTNGEWVEVSYTSSNGNKQSDTLTVLKAFVREEGSKKYVYKRDENNKLKKQYIITGSLSDTGYEILGGLSPSDWIAFPYGKNVKEGAKTRQASVNELYE